MWSWNLVRLALALLAFSSAWVALRRRLHLAHEGLLRFVTSLAFVALLALAFWPAMLREPPLPPAPLVSLWEPTPTYAREAAAPTVTPRLAVPTPTETATLEDRVPTETPVSGDARRLPPQDGREIDHLAIRGLHGSFVEHSFYSVALGRVMPYMLYLPPNYDSSLQPYPVLYLLHGRGGARNQWVTGGFLDAADEGMLAESLSPMLIVFPEGGLGYWTNHANDGPRWGDYVVLDLVAHMDATYRTLPQPSSRAIGGLSMGAWGALHHAFTSPQVFGVAGAHSPALRPDDGTLAFLGRGPAYALRDPLSLARSLPPTTSLQIWIDTGQDDPWAARSILLHNTLAERGIAHAWHLNPGGHDWQYWSAHAEEYLRFYSHALTH